MTDLKIKKGRHYSNEFWPKFHKWHDGENQFCHTERRTYCFTDTCRYNIGEDQTDKNKLYGWSYGCHHTNSVRAAWHYDPVTDGIFFSLYIYENGVRKKFTIQKSFRINASIDVSLSAIPDIYTKLKYVLKVKYSNESDNHWVSTSLPVDPAGFCKYGYSLGLYFGGNVAAPHDIEIKMMMN